jgi:hypothetical protein
MGLGNGNTVPQEKCPHHDHLERRLDEIRDDVRALTMHLLPHEQQRTNDNWHGPVVTVTATGGSSSAHDQRSASTQNTRPTGGVDPLLIKMLLVAVIMAVAAFGGPPAWHFLAQFLR